MAKRRRLDSELVRRGLASSRTAARHAIDSGQVLVGGMPADQPSRLVDGDESIKLAGPAPRFVSRGGEKLDGALDRLGINVKGRWLDAGASTGGFTDCLLQRGATAVAAVDVGYGQLALQLRNDPRVIVIERTNVRSFDPAVLPWAADGVVADLSFISLTLVLPALSRAARGSAEMILLVKPQFESERGSVGKGGVVRDPRVWRAAIERVVAAGAEHDLGAIAVTHSDPPGPSGNREFFVHLRAGTGPEALDIDGAIAAAAALS